MNDETTQATEVTIYENFSGSTVLETESIITVEVIESIGSDIIHADLFGSFLICGTLVGLALLRDRHAN